MPAYKERNAGIYRCTFTGTRDVEFTDKDTGEKVERWDWVFQEVADSSTAGEINRMTPRSLRSPNSNAYKFAAGIIGRKLAEGDDTDAHIGALVDVVYGPNQAGNLAITSVIRVPEAPQSTTSVQDASTAAVTPQVASEPTPGGDLPF